MSARQRKTTKGGAPASAAPAATAAFPPARRTTTVDARNGGHLGLDLRDSPLHGCALVYKVFPGDLISRAGLKANDVIFTVDGNEVRSHAQAMRMLDNALDKKRAVDVGYWSKEDAALVAAAAEEKSRARWRKVYMATFGILLLLGLAALAYNFAPLDMPPSHALKPTKEKARANGSASAKGAAAPKVKASASATVAGAGAGARKATPVENLKNAFGFDPYEGTMEDVEDHFDAMTEAQLVKHIQKNQPEWEKPEWMTLEMLKANLVEQVSTLRRQSDEGAAAKESSADRKKRQLKAKSADELQELLDDVGIIYPEGLSAKALRKIAREKDALGLWESLDDQTRLDKNRERAILNLEKAKAAEQAKKDEERSKQKYPGSPDQIHNLAADQKRKPVKKQWWEQEWSEDDEEEALQRISKLRNYKTKPVCWR